jgi:hypothetical protein
VSCDELQVRKAQSTKQQSTPGERGANWAKVAFALLASCARAPRSPFCIWHLASCSLLAASC